MTGPPARPGRGEAVFLARGSYRRRRLRDLSRMLPVAGAVLIAIPLLWQQEEAPPAATSTALIYLFGVWALLILSAALLSRLIPYDAGEAGGGDPPAAHGPDDGAGPDRTAGEG